jgi:hypothetical protein
MTLAVAADDFRHSRSGLAGDVRGVLRIVLTSRETMADARFRSSWRIGSPPSAGPPDFRSSRLLIVTPGRAVAGGSPDVPKESKLPNPRRRSANAGSMKL